MKILVIGQGGREHAIAWKLAQSQQVTHVYVAPGNAGTHREPKVENVDLHPLDFNALTTFVKNNQIAFTVVGPEAPLVGGIVDFFQKHHLPILGPTQFCAQLEGSKAYAKTFMLEQGIPTAKAAFFSHADEAKAFLDHCQFPIVIKADGLAEGKGVVIAQNRQEAEQTIEALLTHQRFGKASEKILIEEFLQGVEVSFMGLCDGEHFVPLATSQDHKARDNGDLGPNTGGMGAYSPAPMVDSALHQKIMTQIVMPTLKGMKALNHPYVGFLYVGLMITPDNEPKVIEYNCRLGDPETQPLLLRLTSDFALACQHTLEGKLSPEDLHFDHQIALGVVLAAQGYPGNYDKGIPIPKLKELSPSSDAKVFHAGTKLDQGNIVSTGGRVLCVTALGDTYHQAQKRAYDVLQQVAWENACYRTDIGYKALVYDKVAVG